MIWPWAIGGVLFSLLLLDRRARKKALKQPPADVFRALQAAAQQTGVPLELLINVAHTESRFNPHAVSRAGAQGLMQLMPATSASMHVNPFNPHQAALAGARLLKKYRERYGSWSKSLAAYNWGPGNVRRNPDQSSWPASVRRYVKRVLATT